MLVVLQHWVHFLRRISKIALTTYVYVTYLIEKRLPTLFIYVHIKPMLLLFLIVIIVSTYFHKGQFMKLLLRTLSL